MNKRAISVSYNFETIYRTRRAAFSFFAAVVCLLGASAGMAFADEQAAGSGTPNGFKNKPTSSVLVSDEELRGEMNEYLVRNASVIDYLSWKASVDTYLTWKAEEFAWNTSADQYFSLKASAYESLVWETRVNEYLAWRAEVSTYLASKVNSGDYLTWRVNVEDYFGWKASVEKYLPWKASAEDYLIWKTSVGTYPGWRPSVDQYLERKARVKEHSFWQRQRDQANENSERKYYTRKSAAVAESNTRFLRGDVNQDGKLSVQDAKVLLDLVHNTSYEPACLESADVNNDGKVRLGDALQLLNHVMRGMVPPAKPFPSCGLDSDAEGSGNDLGCSSYIACAGEKKEEEPRYTITEFSKALEEQEEASEEDEAEEDEDEADQAEEDDQ